MVWLDYSGNTLSLHDRCEDHSQVARYVPHVGYPLQITLLVMLGGLATLNGTTKHCTQLGVLGQQLFQHVLDGRGRGSGGTRWRPT